MTSPALHHWRSLMEEARQLVESELPFIAEGRMKDMYITLMDVREGQDGAYVHLDPDRCTVALRYDLENESGRILLKYQDQGSPEATREQFRKKVYAAAFSQTKGKRPKNLADAIKTASGWVRRNAMMILTNPENWSIVTIRPDTPKKD